MKEAKNKLYFFLFSFLKLIRHETNWQHLMIYYSFYLVYHAAFREQFYELTN